jgi:serine/threonine-protein kinase
MQIKANDRAGMIPGIIVGASLSAIVLSSRWLPASVVWHFDFSGAPGATLGRDAYVLLMLLFTLGLPLAVRFSLVGWVRRVPDASLNIPNRDFWLAPERRDATRAFLVRQTAWFASVFAVFCACVHLFCIRTNGFNPPHQPPQEFLRLVAGIAVVCIAWAGCVAWRFRKP